MTNESWDVLSQDRQTEMMWGGCYVDFNLLSDPEAYEIFEVGDKVEVLDNCGNVCYKTLTSLVCDEEGCEWTALDESGDNKGTEYWLDSGFFERFDIGIKVLRELPWERDN